MIKPIAILFALSSLSFPLVASEQENSSGWEKSNLWGVKKIKLREDGSYKVKCEDKSKGFISFEEGDICIFSKHKDVNQCASEYDWSFEQAAEQLCAELQPQLEEQQ